MDARYWTFNMDGREPDNRVGLTNGSVDVNPRVNPEPREDFVVGGSQIQVQDLKTKAEEIARAHHTDKFAGVEHDKLVVRRGQEFNISIYFNKLFDPSTDTLKLIFTLGKHTLPGNGTLVSVSVPGKTDEGWTTAVKDLTGQEMVISIKPAANCIIGEWSLMAEVGSKGSAKSKYHHKDTVYILFNPWCKNDTVFFPDEKGLSEYILNDSGCIFTGNQRQIAAMPWFFGQFEETILPASMYCLKRAFNNRYGRAMADPVRVSRALSKIVNSPDDGGVLVGNWSGDYSGGTKPWSWAGSVEILKQYLQTKTPVKFGQCFIFSGLLTTLCRALGLPCRCVTNYSSAHDSDASITIDQHWDTVKDTALESLDKDSVWNFHCWNDVWMKRPDLPLGYGGWQVLDATPQEASDGVFQCGPASLTAILNGNCNLLYDAPFVFAEVNADIVHWGKKQDGEWAVMRLDKSSIGKMISTKRPDGLPIPKNLSDCQKVREDITNQYKYQDESERERLSIINASRSALTRRNVYHKDEMDVHCSMEPLDHVLIGSDFTLRFIVYNKSDSVRTLKGTLVIYSTKYTGHRTDTIKMNTVLLTLHPLTAELVSVSVVAGEYLDKVTENAAMKVYVLARVDETEQMITLKDDFRLRMPDLQLELLTKTPSVGRVLKCRLSLRNPLQTRSLTNCQLYVEGPCLTIKKGFAINDIKPGVEFSAILELTPLRPGLKQIYAILECDQLHDIKGVEEVFVIAN